MLEDARVAQDYSSNKVSARTRGSTYIHSCSKMNNIRARRLYAPSINGLKFSHRILNAPCVSLQSFVFYGDTERVCYVYAEAVKKVLDVFW